MPSSRGPVVTLPPVSSPPTARAVAIVELLAGTESPMKVSQIAQNLGITRSTCTAILETLEQLQWVERGHDLAYQPGPGLIPVANAIRARLPIVQRAEPILRALLDELDVQAAALSRVDSTHLTLVAKSSRASGFDAPPSFRLPIYPPFGASAAAFWTPNAQGHWLDQVPDRPTREHLRRFLRRIRSTGVAVWRLDEAGQLLQDAVAASDALAPTHGLHRGTLSADHRITALAFALGRVGFTDEDLRPSKQPFAVSYIAGTVFDQDDQPCYSLDLHLLRHVSRDELDSFVAALRRASDELTEICGGHPERFEWNRRGRTRRGRPPE